MGTLQTSQFKFRTNEKIGAEGAEQDGDYLEDCFYDRGDLAELKATEKPPCIIVGRTGTGKTALFTRLRGEEDHVAELDPSSLSLHYLSDASILRRLESIGVNLSLFYKLLWRHVLVVELIKLKYVLRTQEQTKTFLSSIFDLFRNDRAKDESMKYLLDWGQSFWKESEYRIKEVTTKLERDVKASLGGKLPEVLESSVAGEERLSTEVKAEVVKHAQQVVNEIQVRQLTKVIQTLADDVFHHPQPHFYIAIDRLDEDWVEDPLRYRLIKALIETAREVNKSMRAVKVIVAIRRDLLDRVIQVTREPGFQEEKLNPLMLGLRWTKEQLLAMLDRRIEKLVRRQYTLQPVRRRDVLPSHVGKLPIDDYLIDRTLYRPRDLIVFFNYCIEQAVDKPEITPKHIIAAEGEYSQRRLRSLRDEWDVDYPELLESTSLLKKRPARFKVADVPVDEVADLCLTLATSTSAPRGNFSDWAIAVVEETMKPSDFLARLICVYYKVGLVGLKLESYLSESWSFRHDPTVLQDRIREETGVSICPVFYRALGVNPDADGK